MRTDGLTMCVNVSVFYYLYTHTLWIPLNKFTFHAIVIRDGSSGSFARRTKLKEYTSVEAEKVR